MKKTLRQKILLICGLAILFVMGCSLTAKDFLFQISWTDVAISAFVAVIAPIMWHVGWFILETIGKLFLSKWGVRAGAFDHPLSRLEMVPFFFFVAFGAGYLLRQMVESKDDVLRGVDCIVVGIVYEVSRRLCLYTWRRLKKADAFEAPYNLLQ